MSMSKKIITILVLLFTFLFVSPWMNGEALAQVCKDKSPVSAPTLTSAVAQGNSVTLTWVEGWGPITHYLVSYGRSETVMEYGSQNIGGHGTTSYTVGNLQTGVKYYFKVRPVNGCKPGKFSNKVPATIGTSKIGTTDGKPNLSIYKSVLGTTTTATAEAEPTIVPNSTEEGNLNLKKCNGCIGWPLLIAEIALLIAYFSFSKKFPALKYAYSIIIPIAIGMAFWGINYGCPLKGFACKYFLPLNIIIFMASITVYKNKYLNRL